MTQGTGKHILIIEDSPELQELLGQLFASEGYTFSRAFNGQQALELLRGMPQPPSFILLDVMMPVMDGFEFRREQASDPRLAAIPVVVMTADAHPQAKALKLGVKNIIKKPFQDLEYLLQVAARLCA